MRAGQPDNADSRAARLRGARRGLSARGAGAFATMLRRVRDGVMASAYPEQCRVCGGSVESYDDGVACENCWRNPAITKVACAPACDKCGAPLYDNAAGRELCGRCAGFPFAAARYCGVYSGALEASVLFLKSHPHVCRR